MSKSGSTTARRRRPEEIDGMVSKIISGAGKPIGAYTIVAETERLGAPMVPTQVYRSVERLMAQDRIERIASLKAFVPSPDEQSVYLICEDCECTRSVPARDIVPSLAQVCRDVRFAQAKAHLEIVGKCDRCSGGDRA